MSLYDSDSSGLAQRALDRLDRQGGSALVEAIRESFRVRTPIRLEEAELAIQEGRGQDVERTFHTLKSSAALIGAEGIEKDARAAEDAARTGNFQEASRRIARIRREYDRLGEALSTPHSRPPKLRIAVVEDNEDNLLLARALLRDRYQVEEFTSGAAALEGILASPPDLVLLDVSMPGMDGFEVLDALRGDPTVAELPIVAVTAHAMRGDRERLLARGFDDYVAKPIIDNSDLIERIQRLVEARR